jgi:hypothetical protein
LLLELFLLFGFLRGLHGIEILLLRHRAQCSGYRELTSGRKESQVVKV